MKILMHGFEEDLNAIPCSRYDRCVHYDGSAESVQHNIGIASGCPGQHVGTGGRELIVL